jgi:hypothetical protein
MKGTSALIRFMKGVLYVAYVVLTTTFLLFSTFELFPSLLTHVNLESIRYYAYKMNYRPDPQLVFVTGVRGTTLVTTFTGDQWSPLYGVDSPTIPYRATFTEEGFRTNSSVPPYDIVLLGDSYLEIGETDEATFSEQLKQATGLSTLNLGRSLYGPNQYLELFKRHGPSSGAKYVIPCFFDGNDIIDIGEHLKWRRGDKHYNYILANRTLFQRYYMALNDTINAIGKWNQRTFPWIKRWLERRRPGYWEPPPSSGPQGAPVVHPDLGVISLGSKDIPMKFGYWSQPEQTAELLAKDEWKELAVVLAEFKRMALELNMTPVVLYIPTKIKVYGSFYSPRSGQRFLETISRQLEVESSSAEALLAITSDLNLRTLNLLPYFKQLAAEGKLLYYPFDTHWNLEGRQAAARFLAARLQQ